MEIHSLANASLETVSRLAPTADTKKLETATEDPQLRQAFQDFVGQTFFSQMLSAMRKTVGKPAYLHGGRTEEVFQSQLDQVLSEKLSDASAETFSEPMYQLFTLQRRRADMTLTLEPMPDMTHETNSEHVWENDLADLLQDLTQVQDELLNVLSRKRQCMATGDTQGMAGLQGVEQALCDRLQQCHDRRTVLLQQVAHQGISSGNLGDLASLVKQRGGGDLRGDVKQASARMRLLQHNCLANWVLAQKALLHVSQMLEIIATGGRLQPTYGNRTDHTARGALVDREV